MKDKNAMIETSFGEITELIRSAKQRAYSAVNTELVNLYWQVGEIINRRVSEEDWGKGTILAPLVRELRSVLTGFHAGRVLRF